jgi:hypothetical protein
VTVSDKLRGISTVLLGKRVNALAIDSVKGHHAGQYTCVATNKAAQANFTTKLVVNGK